MSWRPGNKAARRIANVLLRAQRKGQMPEEYPRWAETTCILAITHSRLTPGTRAQLGRLWRQYGDLTWAQAEEPGVKEELEAGMQLSA